MKNNIQMLYQQAIGFGEKVKSAISKNIMNHKA
jgi:hypothetical protein